LNVKTVLPVYLENIPYVPLEESLFSVEKKKSPKSIYSLSSSSKTMKNPPTPSKPKRCPKGTRKNKKTGECEKK
jgi:hypothetical protein